VNSGTPESIEATGWKCHQGEEQLLEWLRSDRGFWLLEHVSSFCEDQILIVTDALRSFACQSLQEKRESGAGEGFPDALGLT